VRRQRQSEAEFRNRLDAGNPDPWKRLAEFAKGFQGMLESGHRMCLCGMLAAERPSLPDGVAEEVRGFFRDNEAWLATVLRDGRKAGRLAFTGSAAAVAQSFMSAIEGAMLVANAFGEPDRFRAAMDWHLDQLRA
jgi:TetR/AcrR family transcriptional regulator, transcriptional repressor for nem operon